MRKTCFSQPCCYPTLLLCLTHWGRVTQICVIEITIISSNNGLSPCRRQAILCTNAGILLIGTLETKFSEILSKIHIFSCMKSRLKMSSAKWRPFCLGLNVLIIFRCCNLYHPMSAILYDVGASATNGNHYIQYQCMRYFSKKYRTMFPVRMHAHIDKCIKGKILSTCTIFHLCFF